MCAPEFYLSCATGARFTIRVLVWITGSNLHSFAFLCAFFAFFGVKQNTVTAKRKEGGKTRKDKLHLTTELPFAPAV